LKVVHLNTYDRAGGAAKAVYRLHKELLRQGVDSKLLASKLTYFDDPTVGVADSSFFAKVKRKYIQKIEDFPFQIHNYYRERDYSVNWLSQVSMKNIHPVDQADIVCLYWIGHGFLSPPEIAAIKKPIVWRLSDTWPFTGGCHYPGNCLKYETTCGKCPQLKSNKLHDISYNLLNKKLKYWQELDITIVAPSKWIAQCARKSAVFRNKTVKVIPTGTDHHFFSPFDKKMAKSFMGIHPEKKVLLFGANDATLAPRKGYDLLLQILERLDKKKIDDFELLIFGNRRSERMPYFEHLRSHLLHKVESPYLLRAAYCAADLFIAPYREENLPNTVLEAMACGTPCLSFEVGGMPDIILHKKNGYLAQPFDIEQMIDGIKWIFENQEKYNMLSLNARKRITKEGFTLEQQAMSYISLYQKLLNK